MSLPAEEIEIRSMQDAIRWGESWQQYAEELRRECTRLHWLWSKADRDAELYRGVAKTEELIAECEPIIAHWASVEAQIASASALQRDAEQATL